MNINPQSQFRLLRNVPFDRDYMHTILFTSQSAQYAFMNNLVVKSYMNFTYIRHSESGTHKVNIPETADNVYDCNYCMFQNAGFGTKWFYAFIVGVNYINNDVTEITFMIDHWQTWLSEMEIGTCYVEREHVNDDNVGMHTVEENLPVGEYVVDGGEITYDSGIGVIAQMAYDTPAGMKDGVFSGLTLHGASAAGAGAISDLLDLFGDQPEKIAMITMASGNMVSGGEVSSHSSSIGINRGFVGFRFDGKSYVPKNNKLYVYPYCFISLDNYNGNAQTYAWEDFSNGSGASQANFVINESPIPRPVMECYPVNYKGIKDAQNFGVIYDNFPMCPYVIDTYRAWSSQATPKMMISTGANILVGVASGGINGLIGGLIGGLAESAGTLANYAIEQNYHQIHSTSYGGTIAGSGLNFNQERVGFRLLSYIIKPEIAKIIDDYFTRFGYKVMVYKVPNTRTRSSFNYVKTVESQVGGNIPQEAIDILEKSLNRGITLWHTVNVKNYDVENMVI